MRVRASRSAGSKAWLLVLWGLSLAGPARAGAPDYGAFCDRDGHILEDDAHAPAFQAMVRDPQQLDAILADAAKGDRRAARVFEALEKVYFPVVGREVAEREGRPACLAPLYRELSGTCIPNWSYLDYLPRDTEAGRRLRRAVADAYEKRARELGIENRAILSAVNALLAVSVAGATLRQANLPRPTPLAPPSRAEAPRSPSAEARDRLLGTDPLSQQFRAAELEAARRLERRVGRLERDPTGTGDWIDSARRTYDAVGPVPPGRLDLESFTKQISRHLLKQGVDFVVVDTTGFSMAERSALQVHLDALSPTSRARIIVQ